jgi:hypothetical protein
MRMPFLARVMAAACLGVLAAGCSMVPVGHQDPAARAQALGEFRAGQARMACGRGLECAVYWNEARQAAGRLAAAGRWEDVADVVLKAGYDLDLTWFYLGLAAEGLGHAQAARVYYDNAIRLSLYGAGYRCLAAGMGSCDGIRLPEDAQKLLAANEAAQKAAGRNRAAGSGAGPSSAPSSAMRAYVAQLARIRAEMIDPPPAPGPRMAAAQPAACPTGFRC